MINKRTRNYLIVTGLATFVMKIAECAAEKVGRHWFGKTEDERKSEKKIVKAVNKQAKRVQEIENQSNAIVTAHNEMAQKWNAGIDASSKRDEAIIKIAIKLAEIEKKLDGICIEGDEDEAEFPGEDEAEE